MHVRQTYKRSSGSGLSVSMQAADDVTGPDQRKEPFLHIVTVAERSQSSSFADL
jgi:hypothetical protein